MITRKYTIINRVKVFDINIDKNHADYNAKNLDGLYSQEEKHFWFIARKEFILQNAKKYIKNESKIIEIGAGTGNIARYFLRNNYSNVSVGEMHLNGLRYAQSYGIQECYQFDLLNSPFENEFDVVCMFDVLEHISDDVRALKNAHKMLGQEGYIMLTVPSHMWLWSKADVVAGHKIRYTRKELVKKLEECGFEVVSACYFFISITPLLFLRSLINRDNGLPVTEVESSEVKINSIFNKFLLFVSRVENKLNKYLPNWFGGSLLVLAKK